MGDGNIDVTIVDDDALEPLKLMSGNHCRSILGRALQMKLSRVDTKTRHLGKSFDEPVDVGVHTFLTVHIGWLPLLQSAGFGECAHDAGAIARGEPTPRRFIATSLPVVRTLLAVPGKKDYTRTTQFHLKNPDKWKVADIRAVLNLEEGADVPKIPTERLVWMVENKLAWDVPKMQEDKRVHWKQTIHVCPMHPFMVTLIPCRGGMEAKVGVSCTKQYYSPKLGSGGAGGLKQMWNYDECMLEKSTMQNKKAKLN